MTATIRIKAPHFVAGVDVDWNGYVVLAAPILKYMRGWTHTRVLDYCRRKGWSYLIL